MALLSLAPAARAQLYMPRSVTKSYANGTRAANGQPGAKYWQNRARYAIRVSALPPDRAIRGTEDITYYNNSPDSLPAVVLKLFINIHKPGAPRIGGASERYLTSGTHIDAFSVNGATAPFVDDPNTFTNRRVALPHPLAPHDSVRLSIAWHYDISRESNREGMIDSTTYFLAYFYPRVAVYDDTNGWDTMDFTDQQEFYSDFNDYTVELTVPRDYIVWGTGTLENPADVLRPAPLQRFLASMRADTTIRVATRADLVAKTVTTANVTNTWKFRASNIPDMSFALSDHYDWDAASVVVDTTTRRRASVQAAYNDTSADYHHMVRFGRDALAWLSTNWPGVPYPYEKTTVVQGFAGMEYPMMANDESYADTLFSRFVAEHEIAHTYMPFYMGIDETRYGFMDEGWATTFEYLISRDHLGQAKEDSVYKQFRIAGWIADPSPLEDLPIITPADMLRDGAYGNNAYGKPALGYLALKDLLGDATFKRTLHEYMGRWNGKHPIPWDYFNTVNDVSGQDLDWFFRRWYFENSYIDMKLAKATRTSSGYTLVVDNVGGMPAPVNVVVTYRDGTKDTLHQTPAIWASNQKRATIAVKTRKPVSSIELDGGIWMDANTADNTWTAR
ncbi:MAG: M1 family metallopeptidase [Gemmatimonadaceae bacterium]